MSHSLLRFLTFACALLPAQVPACDLALALAVDVSGSVDSHEYRLQMEGLAEGLRDASVSEALVRGKARLKLVQWTGSSRQALVISWTEMTDFEAVETFAARVVLEPRVWRNYSTAIGEALLFTLADFDEVDDCKRRLIDLSGDGPSNEGLEPGAIRSELKRRGVVVNAIAIEQSDAMLTDYFFENVIYGEGAFVVTADSFRDYPDKIRQKLLREVTQQTSQAPPDVITPKFSVITTQKILRLQSKKLP